MKLIEAMKEVKALKVKAQDLREKMAKYSARASFETDTYPDQGQQIKDWMQSHHDTIKRIAQLQISIQRTNLATSVKVNVGDKEVEHSISEWILRRRELAELEKQAWSGLSDKGIKEGKFEQTDGTQVDIKIVRFYAPAERDKHITSFREEPGVIDRTLETVNAVTDLIEA